jgi:hypothetical protein
MSFALLRAGAAVAALTVALPVGAWAQGGLPSDRASAQRTAQSGYDRTAQKIGSDIANAKYAIRACNYIAYERAQTAYRNDTHQLDIYRGAGAKGFLDVDFTVKFPNYPEDCTHPESALYSPSPVRLVTGAQPFVGFNIGGGFQNTNFSVTPPFNVNTNGVIGGGFGGVLFPIPNTNAQLGFRVGGEGSNISGTIVAPPASPSFTYKVRATSMFYEEMMVQAASGDFVSVMLNLSDNQLIWRISAGIAEMNTSVKGTSGMFSVTDSAVRPGVTFTVGVGVPVAVFPNGTGIDLFTQYRGTQWVGTVNIPGAVNIAPSPMKLMSAPRCILAAA